MASPSTTIATWCHLPSKSEGDDTFACVVSKPFVALRPSVWLSSAPVPPTRKPHEHRPLIASVCFIAMVRQEPEVSCWSSNFTNASTVKLEACSSAASSTVTMTDLP